MMLACYQLNILVAIFLMTLAVFPATSQIFPQNIYIIDFLFFYFFGPFLVLGPFQKRVNAPDVGAILKKKIGIRFHIKF